MGIKQTDKENSRDFRFIEETVTTKKRNKRFIRFTISLVSVVFLAVVFGIVSRYIFIVSEDWFYDYFGIGREDTGIKLTPDNGQSTAAQPSATPKPTATSAPVSTKKPEMTITPAATPPEVSKGDTEADNTADGSTGESVHGEGNTASGGDGQTYATGTPSAAPDENISEGSDGQKNDTQITDKGTDDAYTKILRDVKSISEDVGKSIVEVTAIQSGVDWFNETFEAKNSTSGVIIAKSSVNVLIMTNYSDIADCDSIEVTFGTGTTANASIWNYDSDYDIAIVLVAAKGLAEDTLEYITPALFGESYDMTAGTPVILVGKPNGYQGSVVIAMVSRSGGVCYVTDDKVELFQLDTQYTSLGRGFAVDADGNITGYITQKLKENEDDSICTVVGISRVKNIVEKLANKEDMLYFGVNISDIPAYVLNTIGIEFGVYISNVTLNSPAYLAGLKPGDIITEIDGRLIDSVSSFAEFLESQKAGDMIEVKVLRMVKQSYREMSVTVTIDTKISSGR